MTGLLSDLQARAAPLRDRFAALQPREQLVVGAGAIVAGILLLWLALWEPARHWSDRRGADLEEAREQAADVERTPARHAQNPNGGRGGQMGRSVSLLSAVDMATHQGGLVSPPSRLQPEGDTHVRVWFTDIPFETLLRWIDLLHTQYGIEVDTAEIEHKTAPGVVDARLSLVRR